MNSIITTGNKAGHKRTVTHYVESSNLIFKTKVNKNLALAKSDNKIFLARIAGE